MIAILAEKPSVGRDIARVLGADEIHDGYLSGNGYMVTWAFGHLVSLAMLEDYGISRITADTIPFIPEEFKLVPRRNKSKNNSQLDSNVVRQLKIIDNVFKQCKSIIVATDAGREGELIFRLCAHKAV